MLSINDKIDSTVGSDGKLTAAEFNDHKNCIQEAVERSGQTLSALKTPSQFARSLFLNGACAQAMNDNSANVNVCNLTVVSGTTGLVFAENYNQLNGAILEFYKTSANSSVTVYVDVGQDTGTYLGAKPLTLVNGGTLLIGHVLGYCRIKYDYTNDRWELITSQTLLDQQVTTVTNGIVNSGAFNRGATVIVSSSDSPASVQTASNVVISTSADSGAALNSLFTALSAAGGGTLYQCVGTYNLTTSINPTSNIIWKGDGFATCIKRHSTSLSKMVDIQTTVTNLEINNINFDGNKTSYMVTGGSYGVYGNASSQKNLLLENLWTHDNGSTSTVAAGIEIKYAVIEKCKSYSNSGVASEGIRCAYGIVNNCFSYLNACTTVHVYGFFLEESIATNCRSYSNSSTSGVCIGVYSGSASYCFSFDNYSSLYSCFGFYAQVIAIGNTSHSNTSPVYAYGFASCAKMQQNHSYSNTTGGYLDCYPGVGTGDVAANTAIGGFNS